MTSTVSEKMIIPNTINIGFNKRDDTYTKKLAYIVYTDAKTADAIDELMNTI